MNITIANKSVLFSAVAIGSFFKWHGERFQKTKEWVDNNQDNVLCIDAKRGSRFGNNDEVTPIEGEMQYVDGVLTLVEETVKFGDIKDGDTFLSLGHLYRKQVNKNNAEGVVESNAYNFHANRNTVFTPDIVIEPCTVEISVA